MTGIAQQDMFLCMRMDGPKFPLKLSSYKMLADWMQRIMNERKIKIEVFFLVCCFFSKRILIQLL